MPSALIGRHARARDEGIFALSKREREAISRVCESHSFDSGLYIVEWSEQSYSDFDTVFCFARGESFFGWLGWLGMKSFLIG